RFPAEESKKHEYAVMQYELGTVFERAGQTREAEDRYREAITQLRTLRGNSSGVAQDLVDALRRLSGLLELQGQRKEAMDAWRQIVELVPESQMEHNYLAWSLATAAEPKLRDPHRAVQHAQKAVALLPPLTRTSSPQAIFETSQASNTLGA